MILVGIKADSVFNLDISTSLRSAQYDGRVYKVSYTLPAILSVVEESSQNKKQYTNKSD